VEDIKDIGAKYNVTPAIVVGVVSFRQAGFFRRNQGDVVIALTEAADREACASRSPCMTTIRKVRE
jgi:hypothetical protein